MSIGKWIFGFLKSRPKSEPAAIDNVEMVDPEPTVQSHHDADSFDVAVEELADTFDLPSTEDSVLDEASLTSDEVDEPTDNPFRVEVPVDPEPSQPEPSPSEATNQTGPTAPGYSGASLPPRRETAPPETSGDDDIRSDVASHANAANTSPTMSAIPPRGSAKPLRPHPTEPSVVEPVAPQEPVAPPPPPRIADPEPDEIEVLDATAAAFANSSFASDKDNELAELRLALEASHNELSQLTAQRDQATSRSVQFEEETARLRNQIHQLELDSESLQQDRKKVGTLEAEVERLRIELQNASESTEQIQQLQAQHQSTVEELRLAIGQREASEASLARERDNLNAQNEELTRKIANLETAESDSPNDDAVERLAALESQHQTVTGELSLANESIRQLNQNITHRDSQLMSLRQEAEELKAKLEEATSAATSDIDKKQRQFQQHIAELQTEKQTAIAELETQHKTAIEQATSTIGDLEAERKELISKHDELAAKLVEAEQKNASAPTHEEHERVISEIEAQHKSTQDELRALLAERESERDQLAADKENLASQLAEAASESASSGTKHGAVPRERNDPAAQSKPHGAGRRVVFASQRTEGSIRQFGESWRGR